MKKFDDLTLEEWKKLTGPKRRKYIQEGSLTIDDFSAAWWDAINTPENQMLVIDNGWTKLSELTADEMESTHFEVLEYIVDSYGVGNFSDRGVQEAWPEFTDELKKKIIISEKLTISDFIDEDQWEDLEDDLQILVIDQDDAAKRRIYQLKSALVGAFDYTQDEDSILQYAEEEIDEYLSSDSEGDYGERSAWQDFKDELLEELDRNYPEVDWENDEVQALVKEQAVSAFSTAVNWTISVTDEHSGTITVWGPRFELSKEAVRYEIDGWTDLTKAEMRIALEQANDDEDSEFRHYINITEDDIWNVVFGRYGEYSEEGDPVGISLEPEWTEIMGDLDLSDVIEEWSGAPPEQYTERDFEDRILAKIETANGNVYSIIDLLPGELKKESKKVKHCVGKEQFGYPNAVRKGKIRILSVRPDPSTLKGDESVWDKTFTLEVPLSSPDNTSSIHDLFEEDELASIEQVKSTRNRVPGFGRPKYGGGYVDPADLDMSEFVHPDEVEDMIEVIEYLGFDPKEVEDMKPGLAFLRELHRREGGLKSNPPLRFKAPSHTFDTPCRFV